MRQALFSILTIWLVQVVLVDSFGIASLSSDNPYPYHRRRQRSTLAATTSSSSSIRTRRAVSSTEALSLGDQQELWHKLLTEYDIPQPFWETRRPVGNSNSTRYGVRRPDRWAGNFAYLVEQLIRTTTDNNNDDGHGDSFSSTSMSHSAAGNNRGPAAADRVLRRLWREYVPTTANNSNKKNATDRPLFRIVILNKILAAYQRQISNKQTPHRQRLQLAAAAQELFDDWQQPRQESHHNNSTTEAVDIVSFNTIMDIWAKVGRPDQVQRLFDTLSLSSKNFPGPPDIVSYNSLLHAYAFAGHANRVQDILQHMQMMQSSSSSTTITTATPPPPPTVACYNSVLLAHARSNHATAAHDYLQEWISNCTATTATTTTTTTPNSSTVDDDSWSSLQLPPPPAPDVTSYNIVLHALTQQQANNRFMRQRAELLFHSMPVRDSVSYTTLIAAYCRLTNTQLALEAVERTLKRALTELGSSDGGGGGVDTTFCANVLYSVASIDSKEVLAFAESFVETIAQKREVQGVPMDIAIYNALLYCYSKSKDRQAGTKALDLLSKLEQDEHIRPNIKTYTNVLHALKSRGLEAVTQAEQILKRLERPDSPVKPNVQAYTCLIEIYAKSRLYFKVQKAWQVLQRMKAGNNKNTLPNIISYNAVLNACEYTDPASDLAVTEETLKVACLAFDEIRSNPNVQPNHVTYGTFLGVLAKLMPATRRQEIVELVFRRCCKEGQVSRLVLKKLQAAAAGGTANGTADDDWYSQVLLQGHPERRLPREWTSHVHEAPARKEA